VRWICEFTGEPCSGLWDLDEYHWLDSDGTRWDVLVSDDGIAYTVAGTGWAPPTKDDLGLAP
jgi:hypothetical protein